MGTVFAEGYRSGHNGADSKSVWAQAHGGSNPPLSAKLKKSVTLRGFGLFCFLELFFEFVFLASFAILFF